MYKEKIVNLKNIVTISTHIKNLGKILKKQKIRSYINLLAIP